MSLPSEISCAVKLAPAVTAAAALPPAPSASKKIVPLPGSVTICTPAKALFSTSVMPVAKSALVKVCTALSITPAPRSTPEGASFTEATVTVAMAVPMFWPPLAVPLPSSSEKVTVRSEVEGASDVFA